MCKLILFFTEIEDKVGVKGAGRPTFHEELRQHQLQHFAISEIVLQKINLQPFGALVVLITSL